MHQSRLNLDLFFVDSRSAFLRIMSALDLALVVAASFQSSRSRVQVARSALRVTRFAAGSDLVLRGDLSSRT